MTSPRKKLLIALVMQPPQLLGDHPQSASLPLAPGCPGAGAVVGATEVPCCGMQPGPLHGAPPDEHNGISGSHGGGAGSVVGSTPVGGGVMPGAGTWQTGSVEPGAHGAPVGSDSGGSGAACACTGSGAAAFAAAFAARAPPRRTIRLTASSTVAQRRVIRGTHRTVRPRLQPFRAGVRVRPQPMADVDPQHDPAIRAVRDR